MEAKPIELHDSTASGAEAYRALTKEFAARSRIIWGVRQQHCRFGTTFNPRPKHGIPNPRPAGEEKR